MKLILQLIIGLVVSISTSVYSQHNFFFKYGKDLNGTHKIGPANDEITDNAKGDQYSAELAFPLAGADLGFGTVFQSKRKVKEWEGKFDCTSYYGLLRVPLGQYDKMPYLGARIGRSMLHGNSVYKGEGKLNGGIYYSLFCGYCYKFFLFEIAFDNHEGSWNLYNPVDIAYSHVTFSIGLRIPGTKKRTEENANK